MSIDTVLTVSLMYQVFRILYIQLNGQKGFLYFFQSTVIGGKGLILVGYGNISHLMYLSLIHFHGVYYTMLYIMMGLISTKPMGNII